MLSVLMVVKVKTAKNMKRVTRCKFWFVELPNGEIKHELVDLTVEDARIFEPFKNKVISISCGAMAIGRNVVFYVRKGAKPVLADVM